MKKSIGKWFSFVTILLSLTTAGKTITPKVVREVPSYSLTRLCRKTGKIVLWLGSLNDSKSLTLKGLTIQDALNNLCESNAASYSYDDERFIFRKLDFLSLIKRPDFGNRSINEAYRIIASAPDNALKSMPDDYKKAMYGTFQEGVSTSQLNAEGRLFTKAIAQGVFGISDETRATKTRTAYSISANMYHAIEWHVGKVSFAQDDWRSTGSSCPPHKNILWNVVDKDIEKFSGTLEEAIRRYGPYSRVTVDPRIKGAPLFLCYPKGTVKDVVFTQMKSNIPFKIRELAGNTHIFFKDKDITTYRVLTLSDKLYNKSRSCSYDPWQQFSYRDSPVRFSDLMPQQIIFIKGFVELHNAMFGNDELQSMSKNGLLEKGAFTFSPQINFDLIKKEAFLNGKTVVSTHELIINPMD